MNGPRVKAKRADGQYAHGTLVGPAFSRGPVKVLFDSTWPAREVAEGDWELLPEEQDGGGVRG